MGDRKKTISALFRSLLLAGIVLFSQQALAQPISTNIFGQNAWMPDTIGNAAACIEPPCILYGKLNLHWAKIQNSSAKVIRYGGIAPDRNMPTNFQYIRIIDSIRARGMEPMVQVPFYNYRYTAAQAAAIVQYVNITKGKNIKYWVIGNEPDLKYSFTNSAQVAAYFKAFATAMKNVDPTIKIVGPECAWYNSAILNGLLTPGGPDDITGTDANGRFYLDVVSFHYYPFNGSQTRAQVITKLTSVGGLQDNLATLNTKIAAANSYHGRTGSNVLKSAITEANVNYKNSLVDDLTTLGANSFIGGQFVAELYSVAMKRSVEFVTMWSVVEGNTTELNIGYIDKTTGNRKPLFYHYKMLADNFKGNYINTTDNQANVKAFSSQNGTQTAVMIMNQELSGGMKLRLRLNTSATTGTEPLKINVSGGLAMEYTDSIPNQSTFLLVFNSAGVLVKKCEYTLANHAMANIGPTCVEFLASPLPVALLDFNAVLTSENSVSLDWTVASQTNNDHFTVQRTADGINFTDVSTVPGAGTTSETMVYYTMDAAPLEGVSYYRLKQTDHDGTTAYYGMEQITVANESGSITVYPNPSGGEEITIGMDGISPAASYQLDVFDAQGRKVLSRQVLQEDGSHNLQVRFPDRLQPGMYFLSARSALRQYTSKFLVK